jgi:transposase
MRNFLLERQKQAERMALLSEFIKSNPDGRELKRAVAVKMALAGEPYRKISQFLGMPKSCITLWKQKFIAAGLAGIRLGYKGSKGYLTASQRAEIISWLQTRKYWDFDELVTYIDDHYDVIYRSKQSYYDLFAAAGISWKKTEKVNPKTDLELVVQKRQEICEFLTQHQAEIKAGQMVVLFIDECHLLWGDVCGYVWGKTDMRIEIPITNGRERQTYFGALNYQTKEFIVHEYAAGNGENVVNFMKYLQQRYSQQRLVLIWDGASYHRCSEVKDFLASTNQGHEVSEWQFTCILFAPNAPQQDPVEDVWLQGKNSLRKFWYLCKSFPAVKFLFKFFTDDQKFDFPKLEQYAPCSSTI